MPCRGSEPRIVSDQSDRLLQWATTCLSTGGASASHALRELGFVDVDRAGQSLDRLIKLYPVSSMSPEIMVDLAVGGHPDRGLAHLERFLEVAGGGDLFTRLGQSPRLREYFIRLLSQSRFLTDILVRNPERLYWLLEGGTPFLERPMPKRQMREGARREVQHSKDSVDRFRALRRWQRGELLRIGAGEILNLKDVAVTGQELADLADIIIELVVETCQRELVQKYGKPLDEHGKPAHFCVVCLGKHGGGELNFSSDIDLLFVYGNDGQTREHGRAVDNDFFFNRLSEQILNVLTEVTDDGFLYRVDMRLRPDGEAGALTRSLRSHWAYYETRGALWERQMLLKARRAAGSTQLWHQFWQMLIPFVFPAHFEVGPRTEIRRIKERIEAEIGVRPDRDNNIKLRAGGIRDIEFVVQCLQLLAGRRNRKVRSHNTLEAIGRLRRSGELGAEEARTLSGAYRFFRRLENLLQIHDGRAVYAVPEGTRDRMAVAVACGFDDVNGFDKSLESNLSAVRGIFDAVFRQPENDGYPGWERLLDWHVGAPTASAELERAGFENASQAHRTLQEMANGETMTSGARERLRSLLPELITSLSATSDPHRGLVHLVQIIGAYGAPGSFLELLHSRPGFMAMMVTICGSSRFLSELLRRDPGLLDSLVTSLPLSEEDRYQGPLSGWGRSRNQQLLRIGTEDLLGLSTGEETFRRLSALADGLLRAALQESLRNLARRLGKPRTSRGNSAHFVCVAAGKLGGMELNFGSDLDVFFLYEGEGRTGRGVDNREFYGRLSQDLIHLLSTHELYEVDARLRPDGRDGPLVMNLAAYRRYLEKRAAIWERLALSRARVFGGEQAANRRVERAIDAFVFQAVDAHMVDAVVDMRQRMEPAQERGRPARVDIKRGRGGIVDIEFITQIVTIHLGRQELRPVHTRSMLEVMAAEQLYVDDEESTFLLHAYDRLRGVEKAIRITTDRATTVLPEGRELRWMEARSIMEAVGEVSVPIHSEIRDLMNQTRQTFNRVMERLKNSLN